MINWPAQCGKFAGSQALAIPRVDARLGGEALWRSAADKNVA
jgi:hypothetical protein